jgi:hypothetical protein
MEAIRISPQQAEMYDFERNFAQWQQRYQASQRLLADFRQRQEGFAYQKARFKQRRRHLEDRRIDLNRVMQEQTWKQAIHR